MKKYIYTKREPKKEADVEYLTDKEWKDRRKELEKLLNQSGYSLKKIPQNRIY